MTGWILLILLAAAWARRDRREIRYFLRTVRDRLVVLRCRLRGHAWVRGSKYGAAEYHCCRSCRTGMRSGRDIGRTSR